MTLWKDAGVDSDTDRRVMPATVKQESLPPSSVFAPTVAPVAPATPGTLATQRPDPHLTSSCSTPTTIAPPENAAASTQNDDSQSPAAIDATSGHGIFGWTTLDGDVSIPHLLRGTGLTKYVSVRMVEMKLLSKYPSTYPDELKRRAPLVSQFVTAHEARLLDEINGTHCEHAYGRAPFVAGHDLIVRLSEFEDFYQIVKQHFPDDVLQRLYGNVSPVDGGWVQVRCTNVQGWAFSPKKEACFFRTSGIDGFLPEEACFFRTYGMKWFLPEDTYFFRMSGMNGCLPEEACFFRTYGMNWFLPEGIYFYRMSGMNGCLHEEAFSSGRIE